MASKGNIGKIQCPTCGAVSTKSDFGRDGSPRQLVVSQAVDEPGAEVSRRRARAASLRAINAGQSRS